MNLAFRYTIFLCVFFLTYLPRETDLMCSWYPLTFRRQPWHEVWVAGLHYIRGTRHTSHGRRQRLFSLLFPDRHLQWTEWTLRLFPLCLWCVKFFVMISLQFSDPVSSLPQPQLFFMISATSFILANALLHVQNPNLEFDFINFHLMKKGVSNNTRSLVYKGCMKKLKTSLSPLCFELEQIRDHFDI